ncbi:MAG: nicotinate-nucleotide--dimethylbenzimidazole phosphoribosyltransferase [Bacteroidota bacterium]
MTFSIEKPKTNLLAAVKAKIDGKTKPIGALGTLEAIAQQICLIQQTLEPTIQNPSVLVFAGDHGIAKKGIVNPYPQAVTQQMVLNFLTGGAAINAFCTEFDIDLKVINAGVDAELPSHPNLIDLAIARGTNDYSERPAMTSIQCQQALQSGAQVVADLNAQKGNCIGLGEMGIGNTSAASLLMHWATQIPLEKCVGSGTGLDVEGINKKLEALEKAYAKHPIADNARVVLQTFGGFEIVMLVGAILKAAELKMTILIDGFIVSAAALMAIKMYPTVKSYCIFAHNSSEKGHQLMLDYLQVKPLLQLGLRLGEGTGTALAFPIVRAALAFMNRMASFESAGVAKKTTSKN